MSRPGKCWLQILWSWLILWKKTKRIFLQRDIVCSSLPQKMRGTFVLRRTKNEYRTLDCQTGLFEKSPLTLSWVWKIFDIQNVFIKWCKLIYFYLSVKMCGVEMCCACGCDYLIVLIDILKFPTFLAQVILLKFCNPDFYVTLWLEQMFHVVITISLVSLTLDIISSQISLKAKWS